MSVRAMSRKAAARAQPLRSDRRLGAIFENALDAILLTDDDGRFVDANPAACALLGYEHHEIVTLGARDVSAAGREAEANAAARVLREEGFYSGDDRLRRKDGTILEAEFRSVANILPGVHLAIVRDVTERRRAEEEVRRSRRRLEEAEEVAHVGSWEWDVATGQLTWTPGMYRLFGVSPSEFQPDYAAVLRRVHPEDRDGMEAVSREAVRQARDYTWDGRILRTGGEVRHVHARGRPTRGPQGSIERMMGTAQDVTDRVGGEQVRRALVLRLISIHEEERARLSRELHDGAAQSLAALLVGLRRIEDARSLDEVRSAAARQRELVAQTLGEVGRLARGLRPAVLDDLGLRAALDRHAADQAWLFGLDIDIDTTGMARARLPREVETGLYRVAQEAIANAVCHSAADHVRVVLAREGRSLRLTVSDDGRGFDLARALATTGHLGLHTIRERAALLGGCSDIRSTPGAGTTVTVLVPLPARRRRPAAASQTGHRARERQ